MLLWGSRSVARVPKCGGWNLTVGRLGGCSAQISVPADATLEIGNTYNACLYVAAGVTSGNRLGELFFASGVSSQLRRGAKQSAAYLGAVRLVMRGESHIPRLRAVSLAKRVSAKYIMLIIRLPKHSCLPAAGSFRPGYWRGVQAGARQ